MLIGEDDDGRSGGKDTYDPHGIFLSDFQQQVQDAGYKGKYFHGIKGKKFPKTFYPCAIKKRI